MTKTFKDYYADPEFRERQKPQAIKHTMTRYNTDPVFKRKN